MKEEMDKNSKEFFICILQERGFKNIKGTDKFCSWDLEAEKEGKEFIFELKRRHRNSYDFGDTSLEPHKYLNIIKEKNLMSKKAFLVTFFDDCWTLSEIAEDKVLVDDPSRPKTGVCPKTTCFANKEIVEKQFVYFALERPFDYPEDFDSVSQLCYEDGLKHEETHANRHKLLIAKRNENKE